MTCRLPITAQTWHAELRLGFVREGHRCVMRDRRHVGPLRVQKALYPEGDEVCQAILLHPPSGIVGGDHLEITALAGPATHAQLITPGAGKWYRSAGPDASQTIRFEVQERAILEWLPQETIVFNGARSHMDLRVTLAADSRYLGWDILCLERRAAGEHFTHGDVRLHTRVERDGVPLWLERGHIAGGDPMLHSAAGWTGASVCGTLLATLAPGIDTAPLLEACRSVAPHDGAEHGITRLPELIVARYLGHNSEAARLWFIELWTRLRPALLGRPAVAPRLWNT